MCWKCGQKQVIIHTYSLCSLTSLSHINKTFTTQTKDMIKCLTMGGESANILAPWYHFHFFFLKEPLNNFSESFVVLFQQWTDAFPPCFVLLPHLLELSVFRSDDLLENRQCGEIGVSAQLSWPTDAAKHSNSVTRRQHSWDYLHSCMHTFTYAHIHAP